MLPLMRVSETVRLVCTADPSVQTDPEPLAWVMADTTSHDDEAMVVTVRTLRSSEVLRIGSMETHVAVEAARVCTVKTSGPGVDASTPDEIHAILERVRPAELACLGGMVLELSLLPEDPTNGPESGS